MSIDDIDVVELNEAFAAQVLPVCENTGIDIERQLNPHGGAIALGHPFGMTGARIMTHADQRPAQPPTAQWGLETMCAAGGMAMATVVERLVVRAPRTTRPGCDELFDLDARRARHLPHGPPAEGRIGAAWMGARVGPPRLFGGQVASQALCAAVAHGQRRPRRELPPRLLPAARPLRRARSTTSSTASATAPRSPPGGWWRSRAATPSSTSTPRSTGTSPATTHQPPSPAGRGRGPRGRRRARRPALDAGPAPRGAPWPGRAAGRRRVWVRVPARLPDDPMLHAAMLTFLSDMGPVGVVARSLACPARAA